MEQELATGFLSTTVIVLAIAFIVTAVLLVAAEWRILTKAGEKGWKALVPFYGVFVSHHIVGMSHVWFIIEVVTWITELVFEMVRLPEPIVFWFGVIVGLFTLISELIHVIKMCNCFGKGIGFKIGMILLPELFLMIIAFGKAKYEKPEH